MILTELTFECFDNTTVSAVDRTLNGLMDALRYNGQVLGREFPILMQEGQFQLRVVCPDEDALQPKYHSPQVKRALQQLADACLTQPKVRLLGRDLNSEQAAPSASPSWQVLYTTFVHTCSPLRCGDTLLPIPLYRLPATFNGDHKAVIKWQTEWQACDELQMAGASDAEFAGLKEIESPHTRLFQRGWDLRGRIEYLTGTQLTIISIVWGAQDKESELERPCPKCGQPWRLASPLHDIFLFKCDRCRLVSNLSWDFKLT
ncbi:Zn-ribbon-containing protein [Salinivibrio socompensis]|uniref:Zn-ribbon-containing protein n=1 Tax=Salinivibrio socompensis TaxID=1510206 RepID=UPI0004B205A3|nr:Zn-ribbon-containing protein [Salinivibrio socompensis]